MYLREAHDAVFGQEIPNVSSHLKRKGKKHRPLIWLVKSLMVLFAVCYCKKKNTNKTNVRITFSKALRVVFNRPFAAKPSRDLLFLKLWAIT